MRRISLLCLLSLCAPGVAGPFQATGFKVGEVSDTSAIVWARLTLRPKRNPPDAPTFKIVMREDRPNQPKAVEYPEGVTVSDIRDAAPGTRGDVRILYRPNNTERWDETVWRAVNPECDYTTQLSLKGLKPNTHYDLRVESRGPDQERGQTLNGGFRTAPTPDKAEQVTFTVSTGQAYPDKDLPDGYKIYASMLQLDPSFFVHTGDIVYYDKLAKSEALARYHWQRTYGLPTNVKFHNNFSSYFIKDDHDTWINDCWPTMKNNRMLDFTFAQGQAIFREQVPMSEKTYRTRRWGKDLQIWMVEGRDFRSPNNMKDGPDKTIWGKEQMEWLKKTVKESDATFRVLISPTPIVGPDRTNKRDNHANQGFTHEGDEVRKFIAGQKNMVVVCGDRHWQYISEHPITKVREYSCGPASNKHAGGWRQSDFRKEYHKYLKVTGGFMSATVEREKDEPTLTFRHHDVNGKVLNEDVLPATK